LFEYLKTISLIGSGRIGTGSSFSASHLQAAKGSLFQGSVNVVSEGQEYLQVMQSTSEQNPSVTLLHSSPNYQTVFSSGMSSRRTWHLQSFNGSLFQGSVNSEFSGQDQLQSPQSTSEQNPTVTLLHSPPNFQIMGSGTGKGAGVAPVVVKERLSNLWLAFVSQEPVHMPC